MIDTGNISGHSESFVYDALKERLPDGWTLERVPGGAPSQDGSGSISAYYKWTKWSTGEFVQIEVHEAYAEPVTVDGLCDHLMEAVFDMFNDPQARFTTPLWKQHFKMLQANG